MANPFYGVTGVPFAQARGATAPVRNEFSLISAGFDGVNTAINTKGVTAGQAWTGAQNFTGATITVTTKAASDNSLNAASTAYADAAVAAEAAIRAAADSSETTTRTNVDATKAPLISPVLSGVPTTPTAAPGDNSLQIASTAYAMALTANYAPLASPALTGIPTAPTAAAGTSTTQIATMAALAAQAFSAALPGQVGKAGQFVTTDGTNASFAPIRGRIYFTAAQ